MDAPTFVLGVNEMDWKKEMNIISAGCATSTAALPILDILNKNFQVEEAYVTSVHAITSSQNPVDGKTFFRKEYKVGRSAFNVIPASSWIGFTTERVIPKLRG